MNINVTVGDDETIYCNVQLITPVVNIGMIGIKGDTGGIPSSGIPVSNGTDWVDSITATAESDFILSGPSPFSWVKKTLAQVKTILGLGDWSFWGIKNLRLIDVHAGDATRVIVNPSAYNIPILIGDHWHVMTSAVTVSSVDDLDTGSLAVGKDYYIYACTDGTTLSFKVSLNSTNPLGFDANHSRKIGGFHTLCAAVGTISGHTLTGYAQKDILPASIWDLKHRAKCGNNAGMVYDPKSLVWVDIYLASGTGVSTASVNGATTTDTRNWLDFVDDGGAVGKRLLTDPEFMMIAAGSNQGTSIAGAADPVTTGGHVDTAGRRMISSIGCEDCCGTLWQWIDYPSDANMLIAGGTWSSAASSGTRYRYAGYARTEASYNNIGARFVSEPL